MSAVGHPVLIVNKERLLKQLQNTTCCLGKALFLLSERRGLCCGLEAEEQCWSLDVAVVLVTAGKQCGVPAMIVGLSCTGTGIHSV